MTTKQIFTCAIVFICQSVFAQMQQWPMVNSEKGRTSWASYETVLYPPLKEVIAYPVKCTDAYTLTDALTLYNGLLCISLEHDPNILQVFDLQTEDTLWSFKVPETSGANDFTAAQNDSLVFFSGQGAPGLYALYRESGEIKWLKPCGSLYARNVILNEERAYVVRDSLYCIDIGDGSTVWAYPFSKAATPSVDDDHVYLCGSNRALAFDKFDGTVVWEQYNGGQSYMASAVDEMYFYTNSNDTVVARSRENGVIEWAYPIPDGKVAELAQNGLSVSDSFLCFICWENSDGKGVLYTLDKFTGAELWYHTFEGEGVYPPIIVNRVVYLVTDYNEDLFGFDVSTGQQVFHNSDYGYSDQPIVANHRLYVGANDWVVVFENVNACVGQSCTERVEKFELLRNYPNPFNAATEIEFTIEQAGEVSLSVLNIHGQEVTILFKGRKETGAHFMKWNADSYPTGIYICQLKILKNGRSSINTHKLILQK